VTNVLTHVVALSLYEAIGGRNSQRREAPHAVPIMWAAGKNIVAIIYPTI